MLDGQSARRATVLKGQKRKALQKEVQTQLLRRQYRKWWPIKEVQKAQCPTWQGSAKYH